ncbi:MAG: tetratricopeptide repeat protein, partial [Acetobacteraceae bacterium]|nr:tetratricopeptide repeat protein [Acetobacteraceae bacterium]
MRPLLPLPPPLATLQDHGPGPGRSLRVVRAALFATALLGAVASCTAPPPEAYVAGGANRGGTTAVQGEPAGRNARNEECTVQPGRAPPADLPVASAREVYCGGWTQPAARVLELAGSGDAASLDALAAGGLWRGWLEQRVTCGPPQRTTLGNGTPARLLTCTRRNGGWPHLAVVAAGPRGTVFAADGVAAALPVIERLVAGQGAGAGTAASGGRSAAMALAVARLSADAFGAAEVGRYEQLMALGRELNQAENYAAAEEAYRAALALQERVLGRDDPNLAAPLMHLALNLSNQGRHTQARPLFARAEALAPRAADPTTTARLIHYLGLDLLNRGEPAQAAAMLERAEAAYARLAPMEAVAANSVEGDELSENSLLLDPVTQSAIIGLAEARRLRGVALARAGRPAEGATLARDSRELLRRAGLEPPLLVGRSLRSQAGSLVAAGERAEGAQLLTASAQRFGRALPGERPEAATLFLSGARLRETGRHTEALAAFRAGARILRERQIGLPVGLVMPYLDALAEEVARAGRGDATAALQAEMFEAAQLAQRAQTGRLVAQAAARLGASQGNPRVAEAVRHLQDADRSLRALFAERDAAAADGGDPRALAAIDARIAEAQAARAEAE